MDCDIIEWCSEAAMLLAAQAGLALVMNSAQCGAALRLGYCQVHDPALARRHVGGWPDGVRLRGGFSRTRNLWYQKPLALGFRVPVRFRRFPPTRSL